MNVRTFADVFGIEGETDMVAVTYDAARVPAKKVTTKTARAETAAPAKNWFARVMDALIESRMQQAQREIAKHTYLSHYTLDERGNRLVKSGSRDMPFGGW
jgi:hypothetical protein